MKVIVMGCALALVGCPSPVHTPAVPAAPATAAPATAAPATAAPATAAPLATVTPERSKSFAPLSATRTACDDGEARCLEVDLPASGYLRVHASRAHDRGCVQLRDGVVHASSVGRRLAISMARSDGAFDHGPGYRTPCRARAELTGVAVFGPLAKGKWRIDPKGRFPLWVDLEFARDQ